MGSSQRLTINISSFTSSKIQIWRTYVITCGRQPPVVFKARSIDQTSSWTFYNAVGLETESTSCRSEFFTLRRQLIKPWRDSFRVATKLTVVQLSDLLYVIHVAWNRITQNGRKRKTNAARCKKCINFLRAAKGRQINYANSCNEECAISVIVSWSLATSGWEQQINLRQTKITLEI